MLGMADPEMMVSSSGWMPIAAVLLLVMGLLLALKMTAPSDSKGDRS